MNKEKFDRHLKILKDGISGRYGKLEQPVQGNTVWYGTTLEEVEHDANGRVACQVRPLQEMFNTDSAVGKRAYETTQKIEKLLKRLPEGFRDAGIQPRSFIPYSDQSPKVRQAWKVYAAILWEIGSLVANLGNRVNSSPEALKN